MTVAKMDPATVSDCYMRSLNSTIKFVSSVAPSAWKNDTPCTDWNVRDVVNHIVYENLWMVALFRGKTIKEVGNKFEGDMIGSDPIGVYVATANQVKSILAEPDAMTRTCHISSGPISGAEYSNQLFLDTLIHGWDIAVGSKQDATLDSYLVEMCTPLAQMVADNDDYRAVFKAATEGASSSNPQTHLLALLGRDG